MKRCSARKRASFAAALATTFVALLATMALLTTSVSAQMEMPKPGPEHKKLDYFNGNWTCVDPGAKMTMTEDGAWMEGGYFVTIHSSFTSTTMGNGSGLAFLGYDTDQKKYTYNEFNSMGEATQSYGTVDGDTWTWIGDMKMPPGKGRFTEKILSPTAYDFKFEMSSDGKQWKPFMDGKCTKK